MSENYEAIGIAARAKDAIRIDLRRGAHKDRSFFLAAEHIDDLWDGIIVPVYRITLKAGDPVPIKVGNARLSRAGRVVLVTVHGETVQIPVRPLQVHYARNLGETTKVIRPIPAMVTPFAAPAAI